MSLIQVKRKKKKILVGMTHYLTCYLRCQDGMFDTYFTQIVIKLSKNMSRFVTIAHNINKRLFFWQGFYYLFLYT